MDGALVDYSEGRSNAFLNTHKYMIKIVSIIMFPRGGGGCTWVLNVYPLLNGHRERKR